MSEQALSAQRINAIKTRLEESLDPESVSVSDQSHLHVGHAGAKSGRGHFTVRVVAELFNGQPLIKRHRLVYSALGELMETDIHALQIEALSPNEV